MCRDRRKKMKDGRILKDIVGFDSKQHVDDIEYLVMIKTCINMHNA